MGKSHPDKICILTNGVPNTMLSKKIYSENSGDVPPAIPPRMKKKGPALPEKPPHIRAKSIQFSSQFSREPLKPRALPPANFDKHHGTQREILVAASKAGRERPVEKRQREPAKLLMPTTGANLPAKKEAAVVPHKSSLRVEDCITVPTKKSSDPSHSIPRKARPLQPILLIPRDLLPWGSAPVSYALWMQRDAAPNRVAVRREPVKLPSKDKLDKSSTTSARARSGSVTRSGSLTSQGSSSSDSGGETFPKSVLKKQKRNASNTAKGNSNRKVEQKKNVTFNAFATVQLMENE